MDEVCFGCSPGLADRCSHRDTFIAKIKAGSGVEVTEGTHPRLPADVFASSLAAPPLALSPRAVPLAERPDAAEGKGLFLT